MAAIKKTISLMVFLFVLFLPALTYAAPKVIVNSSTVYFDVPPITLNGRTLVPLRAIFQALNADVRWDEATQTITATKDDTKIVLVIGGKAYLNGVQVAIEAPALIINGRTMVPLRFVSESLGCKVRFDPVAQIITITDSSLAETEAGTNNQIKPDQYQLDPPEKADSIAIITTAMGAIKVKFFPKEAPKAVENFTRLAASGYYNGLTFHRIINDFMIQGGDPLGNGTGGQSIWKSPFEDEFSDNLHNYRGALSMANSGPVTNGSQFFIVQKNTIEDDLQLWMRQNGFNQELMDSYIKNGGTPWLDDHHTVFGQVFEGMDVVDKIAAVKTDANGKPVQDVRILQIEVTKQG